MVKSFSEPKEKIEQALLCDGSTSMHNINCLTQFQQEREKEKIKSVYSIIIYSEQST